VQKGVFRTVSVHIAQKTPIAKESQDLSSNPKMEVNGRFNKLLQ